MRNAILCVLAIAAALLQVVLVNGLPLAGGGVPDIALVLVIVLALVKGPVTGMLTGFCAGLCLDLAPPGGYIIGGSAFVLCLIGYGCGRISDRSGGSALRLQAAAVIAICAGEVAQASLGLRAGDSGVALAAAWHGLPMAMLYDVIVCGALLAVLAVTRQSRASRQELSAPSFSKPSFSQPVPPLSGPSFSQPPSSHPAGLAPGDRMTGPSNLARNGVIGGIESWRSLRRAHDLDGASRSGPRPDLGYSAIRAHPRPNSRPARLRLWSAGGGLRGQAETKFRPNRAARIKYRPVRRATTQTASSSLRLRALPRSGFGSRARTWRQLLPWNVGRSARRGGVAGPGGLR
jgi:rod shape-determining protein MreD